MEHLILVGIGGAVGAMLRFELSKLRPVRSIPLGTALVNIIGSSLFGCVVFSRSPGDIFYLVDVGILGGFTTFSTFSFETFRMFEEQDYQTMVVNISINLIGSLIGVLLSFILVTLILTGG